MRSLFAFYSISVWAIHFDKRSSLIHDCGFYVNLFCAFDWFSFNFMLFSLILCLDIESWLFNWMFPDILRPLSTLIESWESFIKDVRILGESQILFKNLLRNMKRIHIDEKSHSTELILKFKNCLYDKDFIICLVLLSSSRVLKRFWFDPESYKFSIKFFVPSESN